MGDGVHAAVEQAAVVRNDDRGSRKLRQPGFEPKRGFKIEVICRFVEQQQVRGGEQGGGQGHTHAPATREACHRAGLGGRVETEPGEDRSGAGGGAVCADGAQPLMYLRQAVGIGDVSLGQQGQALGIALQYDVAERKVAVRRLLFHLAEAGPVSQSDFATVDGEITGDGAQQCGLAGAVATDQADALAGIDREIGVIEQGAAAKADGDAT